MKCKHFLLTAIAMLCWVALAQAAITTSLEAGDLIVQTDQKGVAGYKGCDVRQMKKMPAYVFELQQKGSSANPTCSSGRWRTVTTQKSKDGDATFEDIPDGYYRVLCRVAKAIGCQIEGAEAGYPDRSVVYEQEVSGLVRVDAESKEQSELLTKEVGEDGLSVYPNPATNKITIELRNEVMHSEISISILDFLGKLIHQETHEQIVRGGHYLWDIKVTDLPSGTYVFLLRDVEGYLLERKVAIIKK